MLVPLSMLRDELDQACAFNSTKAEVMATRYREGSRYARHLDANLHNGRRLSFVYYLNDQWEERQGGQLRVRRDSATRPSKVRSLLRAGPSGVGCGRSSTSSALGMW